MKNKVVVITGASLGFGAETSIFFASLGCHLVLVDKNCLKDTHEKCLRIGLTEEDILLIETDLTDTQRLKTIPRKAVEKFGRIDVLINNAGIAGGQSITNTTEQSYNKIMSINCKTVFFLTQEVMPHLIKSKGTVVNVSSVFALRPRNVATAYCVSKMAVNQITQCAALEFGPMGVRVNAVNPGHANTCLFTATGMSEEEAELYLGGLRALYPLGRIATATDVAKAIAFLADESRSSFITGVCMPVDGGFWLGHSRM